MFNISFGRKPVLVILLLLCANLYAGNGEQQKQKLFEKVFGDDARLNPAMIEKVLAGKPGERFYADPHNTGKPTEVWFIDTNFRHEEKDRPVLVRAIDRNGDLHITGEPDRIADIYMADWGANGTVDAVLEYIDTDNDGKVDEMAMYFVNSVWQKGYDQMMVWWSRDVGGDQLLWYDVSYTYRQFQCQERCHFNGAEMFASFRLGLDDDHWTPWFENPFLFYDCDFDGVAEEAIRMEGLNNEIHNVRWSFDANNNATPESLRNYDVSISAHALEGFKFSEQHGEPVMIHGIPTTPLIKYDAAHHFLRDVKWRDILLTWDENDNNVNNMRGNYRNERYVESFERWEGVIAADNPKFERLGGPHCGIFNKRYELISIPGHQIELYYSPTDQRLHLLHADTAWINVDYNMDFTTDMQYLMIDTDGDGIIDRWEIDIDGNGKTDDVWESSASVTPIDWEWVLVNSVMEKVLNETPEQLFNLWQQLEKAVEKVNPDYPGDEVAALIRSGFEIPTIHPYQEKLRNSTESLRYYFDLVKDRLIWKLKQTYPRKSFWNKFNEARGKGAINEMRRLLEQEFKLPPVEQTFTAWHNALIKEHARPRTAYAEDWVVPNIGWESESMAFRAYWGQFDFFGKKKPGLIYPSFSTPDAEDYHHLTTWGIDALHVKNSGGCGGVTLFVNGEAFPVRDPNGKQGIIFEKQVLHASNDTVIVAFTAKNIGPAEAPYSVRFKCKALAGRADSPIEIRIEGGKPSDKLELGIGLTKLPHESLLIDTSSGILATWGKQTDIIGTIGMGIIYPKQLYTRLATTNEENMVILQIQNNKPITYHIQCDWLEGRHFNRSFNAGMWLDELRKTAPLSKLHLTH